MSISNDKRHAALESKIGMRVDGEVYIGALDAGLICTLKDVSSWVEKLVNSTGAAFGVKYGSGGARVIYNKPGELLNKIIGTYIPDDPLFNALYQFEPYIEMVVKDFKKLGLHRTLPLPCLDISSGDAAVFMGRLNECVDQIRQKAKSEKFQSRLKNYQRSSNKNYKELTEYVDSLFERHSRILVLRVDLSYQKQYSKTTQAEAKRDRERLFGNARSNKLFADMVGYIWKLEHGPEKGFHYHMMFFFDGSKVREDITKASLIGRYWRDVVTKGRGLYYNCNRFKFAYKSCGIGMVDYGDAELREGLGRAVIYLTKTDLYMKLQTEGRGMGKGNRPGPKDSRGRPRAAPLSGSA